MRPFQAPVSFIIFMTISLSALAQDAKFSTWNVEWLTLNAPHKVAEAKRSSEDFSALSGYFEKLNSDVIAFQEVDSVAALDRVASSDYTLVLSDRNLPQNQNHQFSDINQFTGFAIRKSIPFADPKDVDLYDKGNHKLRFASYIVLYPESSKPIHLLSLHLKAGCMGKFYSNKESCQTLLSQGKNLNQWIKQREKLGQEYVIMGDFNHNLSFNGDWLWSEFTKGLKREPTLATRNTKALCKVRAHDNPKQLHQFRSVIDHIITSNGIKADDARQTVYKDQDVLSYRLSDHCPISTQVNW